MREILPALGALVRGRGALRAGHRRRGQPQRAPRPGRRHGRRPRDEVVGSVSGGCVEGAVFELAKEVVESGEPGCSTFGYSDEDAFAVGLTCGGEITLLVAAGRPRRRPRVRRGRRVGGRAPARRASPR